MGGGGGAGGEGGGVGIGGSLGVAGATSADVYKKRKSHDLLLNAQVYII